MIPMPILSNSGLPMAMVKAKPEETSRPSTAPIISTAWAGSTGSKKRPLDVAGHVGRAARLRSRR